MAPKRRTEVAAEPSPQPKKRSAKVSATEKKRSREEVEEVPLKGRRKKKVVEEEEEEIVPSPIISTPKQKKSSKSSEIISKSSPVAVPKSALKSASKPRVTSRKSLVTIDLPAAPLPVTSSRSVPSSPFVPTVVSKNVESVEDSGKLTDDVEIISLWNQTWGALSMCLTIIAPVFLAVILVCYLLGTLHQSQAIASVGVVYTLLFMTIMGSYTLAMLPCILVSRLFTMLVSPHATSHTASEINLYSRLIILILSGVGLTYYFLNQ